MMNESVAKEFNDIGGIEMNEKENDQFVISQENWSLHRKGHQDQQRHMEKVKEAIRNNLAGFN